MIVIKIEGNVEWKCFPAKGGNWVGVCDPLALTIQSETWASLMEDIAHALNAMLHDLLETKELNRFLSDHGWRSLTTIPLKPSEVWFDVPFIPRKDGRSDTQAAVH